MAYPPAEAIGYAKEYVVRGLELSLMQRAYRTGQRVFAGIILERLRAATDDADHLAEAMAFFNAWIFAYVETVERRLIDIYVSEREQWVRGVAAVRAAEVRALLGGGAPARRRRSACGSATSSTASTSASSSGARRPASGPETPAACSR